MHPGMDMMDDADNDPSFNKPALLRPARARKRYIRVGRRDRAQALHLAEWVWVLQRPTLEFIPHRPPPGNVRPCSPGSRAGPGCVRQPSRVSVVSVALARDVRCPLGRIADNHAQRVGLMQPRVKLRQMPGVTIK